MTDKIEANYEILEKVSKMFVELENQTLTLYKTLSAAANDIESTWEGEAATTFQNEYAGTDEPAMKRLGHAFHYAHEIVGQIAETFKSADEECGSSFNII